MFVVSLQNITSFYDEIELRTANKHDSYVNRYKSTNDSHIIGTKG